MISPTATASDVFSLRGVCPNEKLVLLCIIENGGQISDIDICGKTGMLPRTVVKAIGDLVNKGLLSSTTAEGQMRFILAGKLSNTRETKDGEGEHYTLEEALEIVDSAMPSVASHLCDMDTPPMAISALSERLVSIPTGDMSGVYFLCRASEIIYVGQSVSVLARVSSHIGTKEFDSAFALPVPVVHLSGVEGAFIKAFSPQFNISNGKLISPTPSRLGTVLANECVRHVVTMNEATQAWNRKQLS